MKKYARGTSGKGSRNEARDAALRGSDNLYEAIQDIAVVLHEHFRPDAKVSSSNIGNRQQQQHRRVQPST